MLSTDPHKTTLAELPSNGRAPHHGQIAASGVRFAASYGTVNGREQSVHIYRIGRAAPVVIDRSPTIGSCADFSPDGCEIGIERIDGTVRFYDLSTGGLVRLWSEGVGITSLVILDASHLVRSLQNSAIPTEMSFPSCSLR
jgi:hypothetical protein